MLFKALSFAGIKCFLYLKTMATKVVDKKEAG